MCVPKVLQNRPGLGRNGHLGVSQCRKIGHLGRLPTIQCQAVLFIFLTKCLVVGMLRTGLEKVVVANGCAKFQMAIVLLHGPRDIDAVEFVIVIIIVVIIFFEWIRCHNGQGQEYHC